MLDISLSLEFAPPWRPRHGADVPYVVRCEMTPTSSSRKQQPIGKPEIAPYPER